MNAEAIRKHIETSLLAEGYPERIGSDVAFHMTDWAADLEALNRYFADPDSSTSEEVARLLIEFLLHVPNHVAAASKLLTDIPVSDVFDVNAVESPDESDAT